MRPPSFASLGSLPDLRRADLDRRDSPRRRRGARLRVLPRARGRAQRLRRRVGRGDRRRPGGARRRRRWRRADGGRASDRARCAVSARQSRPVCAGLEAGCLLTEAEDGADAQPGRFLTRNRLIAALGRSTVVVQAPARSGALSTARFAKRLGRPVFAVPASPWDPRGSGNLRLLAKGARICVRPGDVLSETALRGGGRAARVPEENRKHSRFQ